jgi:hypothetical protein
VHPGLSRALVRIRKLGSLPTVLVAGNAHLAALGLNPLEPLLRDVPIDQALGVLSITVGAAVSGGALDGLSSANPSGIGSPRSRPTRAVPAFNDSQPAAQAAPRAPAGLNPSRPAPPGRSATTESQAPAEAPGMAASRHSVVPMPPVARSSAASQNLSASEPVASSGGPPSEDLPAPAQGPASVRQSRHGSAQSAIGAASPIRTPFPDGWGMEAKLLRAFAWHSSTDARQGQEPTEPSPRDPAEKGLMRGRFAGGTEPQPRSATESHASSGNSHVTPADTSRRGRLVGPPTGRIGSLAQLAEAWESGVVGPSGAESNRIPGNHALSRPDAGALLPVARAIDQPRAASGLASLLEFTAALEQVLAAEAAQYGIEVSR